MCLKYNAGTLKLNPMKQSTIGLPRFSSSLSLRMQCAHRQSRGLYFGFNVGKQVGKKKWTNDLGFVELMAKKTMEQSTITKMKIKIINTLNPHNKVLPTTKGNELNQPFICFFRSFFFFLLFFFFFCFFIFFTMGNKSIKRYNFID